MAIKFKIEREFEITGTFPPKTFKDDNGVEHPYFQVFDNVSQKKITVSEDMYKMLKSPDIKNPDTIKAFVDDITIVSDKPKLGFKSSTPNGFCEL